MSDSDTLKDISDDLKYFIKSIVPNSVYKNEENPDPGGGGGGATPTITVTVEDEAYIADKTFAEISALITDGQFPIMKDCMEEDFTTYAYLQFFMPETVIVFATPIAINEGDISMWNYTFLPDDSIIAVEHIDSGE